MPKFSAFTPYGQLSFSSKPSHGERIYRDMLRNGGAEANFAPDSNLQDKWYADAMLQARCLHTMERAGRQHDPLRTQEILPTQEFEHGLTPTSSQTKTQRRQALSAVRRLRVDGQLGSITQALYDLLGSKFLGYRAVRKDELGPESGVYGDDSLFVPPGSPRRYLQLDQAVAHTFVQSTVLVTRLGTSIVPFEVGETLLVDPSTSRAEQIALTAIGDTTITALFEKPHDAGTMIVSQQHPIGWSDKRRHIILLADDWASDADTRRLINNTMRKLVKGTAVWEITSETAPGKSGPFKVGEGLLGITTIGELTM